MSNSGKGSTAAHRLARAFIKANPQVTLRLGKGAHYSVLIDGKLVGILPCGQAKEGLSPNLISQFRRAGLVVPGHERKKA